MTEKKFKYSQALKEIESIVSKLESENPDVDELSGLVKKATFLIKQCKKKLRETGDELEKAIEGFDEE